MSTPKKHRGAVSELKASAWLLEKGYEVFRNVSPFGPVDIIAMDPNTQDIIFVDVKTKHPSHKDNLRRASIPDYVKVLTYEPTSGEIVLNPSRIEQVKLNEK